MDSNLIKYFNSKWKYKDSPNTSSSYYGRCYILYNQASKRYKIGISEQIEKRINKITTESGCLIDLVMCILSEGGDYPSASDFESILHSYFKKKRFVGEWFTLDKKDLLEIYFLFVHVGGIENELYLDDHFDKYDIEYELREFDNFDGL